MPPITESFAARPTLVVRRVARADEPEPSSIVLMHLKGAATPLVFRRGRGLFRIAASAHPDGVWHEAVALTPMALVGCIMPTLARVVDESGVPCELPMAIARAVLRHGGFGVEAPRLRVVAEPWSAQSEAIEIHEHGDGWVQWPDRLKHVVSASLQARIVGTTRAMPPRSSAVPGPGEACNETAAGKEWLVDRHGGWKHDRWRVDWNADDTAAVMLFQRELGLAPTRRRLRTDGRRKYRRNFGGHFGLDPDRLALGLDGSRQGPIGDHPRAFNTPGAPIRSGIVAACSPYLESMREVFGDEAALARFDARLLRLGLAMRVVANGFYNPGCPTLLFFRADDVDLLERISRTAGYIAPVESVR